MNKKTETPSAPCCGTGIFWETLYFLAPSRKIRFGIVRVCSGCKKPRGDVNLDQARGDKDLSAILSAYNGTSWAAMLEKHPYPPFNFERGTDILLPEGYTGNLKAQGTLPEASQEIEEDAPPF